MSNNLPDMKTFILIYKTDSTFFQVTKSLLNDQSIKSVLFLIRLEWGYGIFSASSLDSDLLPGLYSEMVWDKERKEAFGSKNKVSCRIDNEMD